MSEAFASAKAAGVGLLTVLKSFAPVLAGIATAFVAFKGFQWLDDKLTLTKGTADKHYEESIQKYTQAQSDLSNLQSQYENNQQRIYELRAKQNRSQSDNLELDQLQSENNLLGTQVDIKERLVSSTQKQAALDADTKLNKVGFVSNANMFDEANRLMDEINTIKQTRIKLYEIQKSASNETPLFGESEYDLYQKQIDGYEKKLTDKESDLAEIMSEIFNTSQSLWDENGNLINKSTKDTANKVKNLINDYEELSGSAEYTNDKIHNMFSKEKFDGIEDNLISIAKTSGKDSLMDKISEVEGLSEAMQNASIDAETLANYIMSIADPEAKDMSGIKQNLNDMFGDIETDDIQGPLLDGNKFTLSTFLNGKKDSELENFWNYLVANNYDGSNWSLKDLISNWNKAQEQAEKEIKNDPISLSDLLDKGEEAPSTLQDVTDKFQSNISSIKSAMDSLKTGDFKSSDITDLIQQFPELASETDNLEQGLSKLTLTKLGDAISGIRKETSKITDPKKKKEAENYIQLLMDSVDLSNVSFDNIQSEITKNVMGSSPNNHVGNAAKIGMLNQLFGMYSGDEAAMQAILKLSVDPSMASASIEEWVSSIEALRPQIEIDISTKKIENLQKDLSYIQNEASRMQSEIDNKSSVGLKVTESDYAELIENGNKQIANLKDQIAETDSLLIKEEPGSDKYKQYQEEIDSLNASIDSMIVSQIEWNEAMQNLPVTNAQNLTSALSSAMSELQSETGLTNDSIKTLNTQFSDLERYDPSSVFYASAKGVKVNTSALKDFINQQNTVQEGKFAEEIKRQKDAIKSYQDQIGLGNTDSKLQAMQNNLEGLMQRQAQYFAQYKSQMEQMSDFQAIQNAKNTKNAGSNYDQMISDLKTAKEAYDKDLVGTDDFKTVAKYLSPNGFEDAANFAENYAKAKRYLTEDSSKGVVNFLDDLNKKGYATYETLANGAKQWSLNIEDAKKAAYDMGMGEEFFTDVLDKTEDYGFVNATVNSLSEGSVKIEEANTKLVDAYAKLAEMQTSGASTVAIEDQKAVIEQLKGQVSDLTTATETYKEVSAKAYGEGLSNLEEQISLLEKSRKETLNDKNYDAANELQKRMQATADKYGVKLKITAEGIEIDDASYQQALKDAGIGSVENPLSAEDLGLSLTPEQTKNFDTTKSKLIEQKDAFKDYYDVLRQYSAEDLKDIQLSNGSYDVSGDMMAAEDALQAIADQAGLSQEQVSQLLNVLQAIGALKPKIDVNTQSVQDGITKLERMQELGQINSNIDLNADISEMTDDELSQRYTDLINIKAKIVPDTDEYNAVCALIEQTTLQMKINTAIEEAGGIDELLALGEEGIQTAVGCDDSEVDGVIAKLEEMKNGADIPIIVQMEEGQFNQLLESKDTSTITVDANNQPAKEKIDEAVEYGNDQTAEMTVKANTAPAISAAAFAVHDINRMNPVLNISGNADGVKSAINSALSGPFSISVSASVFGLGMLGSLLHKADGTMSAPAHAYGTAYNAINYTNAYANGKVALEHDEVALVNELGRESIVRGDKWMLLPPGMHTQALKKGDIVLNAQQTEDLIKHGKANGHARALAQGTLAYDGMPAHATNGGGVIGGNKYTSDKTTVKNLNDASKNIKKASEKLSSAADDTKEAFDYIQIKLERLQTKYDNYIRNAEAAFSLSSKLSNYNKANSTIAEQIKANEQGAARYKKEANSVGLDKSIAKLVQSGTIDIKKYDENTQKLISDYQNWYELMKDCENAAKDLKVQQKELAQTKIDTIADRYSMYAGYADARTNYLQGELDYREAAGYSNVSKRQKYIYDTSIKQEQYKINQNQTIAAILQKEIDAQLKSGVMKKGDEAWYAAQEQLRGLDEEIYASKTAIAEYNQELRNINTTKLQRAFDKISRWADQLKGLLNLKEARGQNVTEQDYMSQITANNDQILAQYSLLQNYLDEQSNYEYGSEKWQELAEKIADTKNNINDLLVSNEELQNSIVEERWESFNKLNEDIDLAVTELDYLRNALNESVDPLGNLTDDGQANIALIGKEMALQKQRIADYNKALEKLDEQYKNGNVDQNEYNEKQKEFRQVIRESSDSVRDYEDSLIDLWKSQIQARNDALQEEIDLRQKALESKKKYYDYDKQLKSQTKELNILKAQAAALEGVADASSKAKLAKIKAQIADAEEDLADTKYEHEYDLKVTGYETLKDDVQKQLDDTLDELEISSELQQNVVDSMLGNITTNYETAYTEINNLINESGLSISNTATLAIDSFKDMESAVNALSEAIKAIPEVKPTQTVEDVKTSEIVTNKGTGGKTTTDAEKASGQKENTKNTVGTLPPSNQGSQSGKASSIKLDKSSVSLKVGASTTLKETHTPANASVKISWKSSNTKVATVSSTGVVKAKAKGSAVITVTDENSKQSAKCTVKVTGTTKPKKPNSGSTSGSGTNTSIWSGIAKDTSDKGNKSLNISQSIVDRMKYNGYASDSKARAQLWKNLKGSGAYSSTAAQNVWMLEKLKKAGYSKGGIIDDYIPADMLGFLGKAVIHNGDSGVIGINPGEYVIPEEFARNMKPAMDIMKAFNENVDKYTTYNNVENAPVVNVNVVVEGNADANTVRDLNKFGKELANNKNFVDAMTGKISLNIAKDANKAGIVRKIR